MTYWINNKSMRYTGVSISLFAILATIISCSNSSPIPTVIEAEPSVNAKISETRGDLVIYSGRGESLINPIIKQFRDATGINVAVKYAKTTELAATLQEEGEKTPADVFLAQDPGGLGAVEDMLAILPKDILGLVPLWAHSNEGKWVGISGRARTVIYNPENLMEADLPDDMWGFVDPKWKGRIGWAPTNASFQTMVTAMRYMWGESNTREWIEGIHANDPTLYPKNTPQVVAVASGEIDVGFVNHYYLFRFLAEQGEDFTARNYHPRSGGPGAVIMVSGAGVLLASKNSINAHRFLEFMLSEAAQQYFAEQTFEYPLAEGVKTSRFLVPLDDLEHPNIELRELTDTAGTIEMLREAGVLP